MNMECCCRLTMTVPWQPPQHRSTGIYMKGRLEGATKPLYDMRCRHFVTYIMRAGCFAAGKFCARFAGKTATPKKLSDVSKYVYACSRHGLLFLADGKCLDADI